MRSHANVLGKSVPFVHPIISFFFIKFQFQTVGAKEVENWMVDALMVTVYEESGNNRLHVFVGLINKP